MMHRVAAGLILGLTLFVPACAKRTPTTGPVMVESVLPGNAPVCFPDSQSTQQRQRAEARAAQTMPVAAVPAAPATAPNSPPSTAPLGMSYAHWCQLCEAARQRAAEFKSEQDDFLLPPEHDLLIDLPPR